MSSEMDKINFMLNRNDNLIDELSILYSDIMTESVKVNENNVQNLNVDLLNYKLDQAKIIDKKIKDNVATINQLIASTILTQEYFEDKSTSFLKKAQFYNSDLSADIIIGSIVDFQVQFRNMGMFYSWSIDKNISLDIAFTDTDNNIISQSDYILDTELNVPGDELTNGDFSLIKTFNGSFTFPASIPPGDYKIILRIKDNIDFFESPCFINVTAAI